MAKPMPAAAGYGSGSGSSSDSCPHLPPYIGPSTRLHRRTPRSRSHSHTLTPSPALLSILATIVASSTLANGSPAPPSFLCPSLSLPDLPSQTIQRRSISSSSPTSTIPKTRYPPRPSRSRPLPPKFEPGEDGVWRRVEEYTLYGSTVCSKNCRDPTNAVNFDNNNSMTTPSTSVSTTDGFNLYDSLPDGWFNTTTIRSESRTTLILALSLVLAFFILFFIVGCLFWRKNVRRKHKDGDLEMRVRRRSSAAPSPSSSQLVLDLENETKVKQKIWARATARWRANARYVARQRRGKRPVSIRSQHHGSTATLNPMTSSELPDDDVLVISSVSQNISGNLSRQSSSTSLRETSLPAPGQQGQEEQDDSEQLAPVLTLNSAPDVSASPPAYRQRTLVSPIIIPPPEQGYTGPNILAPSPHPSHLSFGAPSIQTKSELQHQETESLPLPVHAAHVATDDKALLARLADFADRPPDEVFTHAESSRQVSAPIWEDEQLEDFALGPDPSDSISSDSATQLPFPPPPSKGKMAELLFYEYPYAFEEFSESIEPELEPSAPPFEAPGAPVTGDLIMLPSAPSLPEEEYPSDTYPESSQLDAAAGSSVMQTRIGETRSECATVEHSAAPAQRPLSEGTLPDYQP